MHIVTGLILVSLAMVIAVGGLVLVQRLVPTERRQRHNDVAGFIYAVVGVAYAVLLGLMLIAVWEEWNEAEATTTEEANELAEIFWLAHRLPEPEGRHIQELARSYAEEVVNEEWPLMKQGGEGSARAWDYLDEMRGAIEQLDPSATDVPQVLYNQALLERLHGLADARKERLLDAEKGLPSILWVVLILGGAIAIGFTYLFGLENSLEHTLMVAALTMIFALTLFTVAALDYPFRGDVHVEPTAFEQVLERFETSELSHL